MATSVQFCITLSLLALSAILLSTITSTRAAPVTTTATRARDIRNAAAEPSVPPAPTPEPTPTLTPETTEEYFRCHVVQKLSDASYMLPDNDNGDLLISTNDDITGFLRKVCDVVAYSELAAALHESDQSLLVDAPGVSYTNQVNDYQSLLSTITTNTCKWAKQLAANPAKLVANPPFDDNSCTGHITYLHRHCFILRVLSRDKNVWSEAHGAARNLAKSTCTQS